MGHERSDRDSLADPVYYSSARALALAIVRRDISSEELVRACLDRIENRKRCGSTPSCRSERRRAIARAREADAATARGERWGPLHGVPMTIKDSLDTAGMITTGGTKGRATFVPERDATVVARLRKCRSDPPGQDEYTGTDPVVRDEQSRIRPDEQSLRSCLERRVEAAVGPPPSSRRAARRLTSGATTGEASASLRISAASPASSRVRGAFRAPDISIHLVGSRIPFSRSDRWRAHVDDLSLDLAADRGPGLDRSRRHTDAVARARGRRSSRRCGCRFTRITESGRQPRRRHGPSRPSHGPCPQRFAPSMRSARPVSRRPTISASRPLPLGWRRRRLASAA